MLYHKRVPVSEVCSFTVTVWKKQSITRFLYVLLLKTDFPSVLFIFAAQEFFSENKWLKFHDFSMTLSIFHDFA